MSTPPSGSTSTATVPATRDRHAAWFAGRAREWEGTVGTPEETATWPQLGFHGADLRAALDHSLARGPGRDDDRLAGGRRSAGSATPAESWSTPTSPIAALHRIPRRNRSSATRRARPGSWPPAWRRTASETWRPRGATWPRSSTPSPVTSAGRAVARAFLGHVARERGDLDVGRRAVRLGQDRLRAPRQRPRDRVGRARPRPARPGEGRARRGGTAAAGVAAAVRLRGLRLGGRGLLVVARLGAGPQRRRRRRRRGVGTAGSGAEPARPGRRPARGRAEPRGAGRGRAGARCRGHRGDGSRAPRASCATGSTRHRPRCESRRLADLDDQARTARSAPPPPTTSCTPGGRCRPPPCSSWPAG